MRHLKRLLFGIILSSSFSSACAGESDSSQSCQNGDYCLSQAKQDVFDQIVNTLVPTLIVLLFDTREPGGKKTEDNEELSKFDNITPVKIKRAFDDLLCLISLFVLPSIVFFKDHKQFATPLWISILSCILTGFAFIIFITTHILFRMKNRVLAFYVFILSALVFDLSHVIFDICFIFNTKNLPPSNFTEFFIYSHAVTGILSAIFLLFFLGGHIYTGFLSGENIIFQKIEKTFRKRIITITFIWTPIVQMLNMSLLSGNDYYWTKSILAVNLIYLSRVIDYTRVENIDVTDNKINDVKFEYHTFTKEFSMLYGLFSTREQEIFKE
ncbi:hypothetical protein RclHR1_00720048 [Rhizophagus clarus]|uniref:Uncharacterized protein n=1 Tax=Rhizophagus clarus TaxID=94130 RepID=A0A2Z6SKV4_9GLOM|nr:hypothetical protein RclHR1_00720048 [Rhizophagus clarus]GES94914.1 hypothetical protein GLOIN_2v1471985 [Rhizophagus clarus]